MKSITCKKVLIAVLLIGLFLIPNRLVLGQSVSTQVGVFNQATIAPAARIEVPIEVKKVNGLYALDLTMQFDPTILAAEDADPSKGGTQLALGNFLDAGLVLYNTVDNQKGIVHFVMTQVNPSEPKNGDGVLLVIYFKALKAGESALTFSNVQLSDRDGIQIPATSVDSTIKVVGNAPAVVSTSIPVQESTKMIQIPTEMPTSTPTPAMTATPATISAGDKSAANLTPEATQIIAITGGNEQTNLLQAAQLFLFRNWWIVLILLLLVIIAAVYLVATRKETK
ncbi:MAG: cohesin domain-containing protein [Anaerolineaceae bacterium]